jgi:hypothetical protein
MVGLLWKRRFFDGEERKSGEAKTKQKIVRNQSSER